MAATGKRLGLVALAYVLSTMMAVAACTGDPELVYRAQSPLLATQRGTALELRLHADGCLQVDYPRQQGGGSRTARLDAESLAALHDAAARSVAPPLGPAPRAAPDRADILVLDADLLSVSLRKGSRWQHLHWRHGDAGGGASGAARSAKQAAALAELRRECEGLAEALRGLPP
jgi:hypothetical protein